ncbi:1,4-beta-xylanase [Sediminicola sp. YIK13]|uniref:alpha/beta hydrolase n=1 Tax=Sediminicola sp. YIK13 TaxID=1453352 RepID=UPI000720464A|nr:alpha/beta hydrolase [Sediminicola sp. YIK13]ALM07577.1 1,4-beta-xylanase [Sediminicola sp. YIK13]
MKYLYLLLIMMIPTLLLSQEIVHLPSENSLEIEWKGSEKTYYSEIWKTQVVTNVSKPSMEVFRPDPSLTNGTAVIIAPGGGLYAHSINSEGNDVARWLNSKGITAFVLKYRLVPTGEDAVSDLNTDGEQVTVKATKVLPLSTEDGLNAIRYVRKHSGELDVDSNKIGFMGFSAGGAVTMSVIYSASKEDRPDFLVPIYPWMDIVPFHDTPSNGPPMLIICATDDPLGLAPASIALYTSWAKKGIATELHMYSKGGHGFGMKTQGLPSDNWIERFYDWSIAEGLTNPIIKY